jgi:hypothetical protein
MDRAKRRIDDHRIRRRIRRKPAPYDGPFACRIELDGSDDPTEIRVGQGFVFAGTEGYNWDPDKAVSPDGNFDDATDYDGTALTTGTYYLVMAVDVNPDIGAIDLANDYGPELFAVPSADILIIQDEVGKTQYTHVAGLYTGTAVFILCSFAVDASKHFSNLKQRWKWQEIYAPTFGWTGTGTAIENWTTYHPYYSAKDQADPTQWYECSWHIDLAVLWRPLSEWIGAHDHDINAGLSGSRASADPDTGHTHGTGDYETSGPHWQVGGP